MQEVLGRPTVLLAAVGPQNPREAGAAEHQQCAQRLALGTQQQSMLDKHQAPLCGNRQKGAKQHYVRSPSSAKVFFLVRMKRSPRSTFLLSEETSDSRSTATPKLAWMRSMITATCSGVRAF